MGKNLTKPGLCACDVAMDRSWGDKFPVSIQYCPLHTYADRLLDIAKKLCEIDCCDGYEVKKEDYPKLWDALNAARQVVPNAEKGIE